MGRNKNTPTTISVLEQFLRSSKHGQTCGSCVMHSYWFILNYFSAIAEIENRVTFNDLNKVYLLWMEHKMNGIHSQQEGIRDYLSLRQTNPDFKCMSYHKAMYRFVLLGADIPTSEELDSLVPRDLELLQTSVLHYYCQGYVQQNDALYAQYKMDYPTLCGDGIRGYLNIYEFDQFLASDDGAALLAKYSTLRPNNYTLDVPKVEQTEHQDILNFLAGSIGVCMVLFNEHSRVLFENSNTKYVYDSNNSLSTKHIMGFNEYLYNNPSFIKLNSSDICRIECLQAHYKESTIDSSRTLSPQ